MLTGQLLSHTRSCRCGSADEDWITITKNSKYLRVEVLTVGFRLWSFWLLHHEILFGHLTLMTNGFTLNSIFSKERKAQPLTPEQPLTSISGTLKLDVLLTKLNKCFRKEEQRIEVCYSHPWNLFSLWNWTTKLFRLWLLWILWTSLWHQIKGRL